MTNTPGSFPDAVERRLEFETLISDTSAALLASAADQVEAIVERTLDRLRRYFRADRCALLSVSADKRNVRVLSTSDAEDVIPVPPELNLAEAFPWARQRLLVDRLPVRATRIEELPPEAAPDLPAWTHLGIRSILTIPIEIDGAVRHLILIQAFHAEREWPEIITPRLRVLGELLVGTLERSALLTALRRADERVSVAAEAAAAGLWCLDLDTRTFWVTDRARAIFRFPPEEVVTLERFEALVHPDDSHLIQEALDRASRGHDSVDLEYRILLDDGSLRWISSRGRAQFRPTGQLELLTGASIDITDEKTAAENLRRSETRQSLGAELAGLAYYEVDLGRGITYADERFHDLCGVPPDRRQGLEPVQVWIEGIHPDDRPRVLEQRQQLHDGRLSKLSIEYRFLHPVRGTRWIHHLAGVLDRGASGRAVFTYGVLRDITERKKAEEGLASLSRRLIRSHEDERAFLARELHDDLSQRIAALAIEVGRTERAMEGAHAESLRAVRCELASLGDDVHSLAYNLHPSVLEDLGLAAALRAACERFGRSGGGTPQLALAAIPPSLGRDEALCLFRVAQEALSNVTRHACARSVRISLQRSGRGLRLTIQDDGIGFAPATPRSQRSLGLESMRERTHLLGGTFELDSTPGHGTTIAAWVPTKEESP
jgi:PAS domain S-box-containing protein